MSSKPNAMQDTLSPGERARLCAAAQAALDQIAPGERKARFVWRGQTYFATRSIFRLCVELPSGEIIAWKFE